MEKIPNTDEGIVAGRVSRGEILHLVGPHADNRLKEFPLTAELEANLARLLIAVNKLRRAYDKPMVVSSGYRPSIYNTRVNGALHSAHLTCRACDFVDGDRKLTEWCLANLDVLKDAGLWMESPKSATSWVHVDLIPRPVRVFLP